MQNWILKEKKNKINQMLFYLQPSDEKVQQEPVYHWQFVYFLNKI